MAATATGKGPMKYSRVAVCASCEEVFEVGPASCPSCGDGQFFLPSALMTKLRFEMVRDVVRALTQASAVGARNGGN